MYWIAIMLSQCEKDEVILSGNNLYDPPSVVSFISFLSSFDEHLYGSIT